ncbi:hypothetical protein QQM79_20055 [Marinobacteraceae bacterium S3BR75-40.1]
MTRNTNVFGVIERRNVSGTWSQGSCAALLQIRLLLAMLVLLLSAPAAAKLKPMDNNELSHVIGQAFVSINRNSHPVQTNLTYTRINLGMDVELNLNADVLELGRYEREGESQPADILINNFGLGYIQNKAYFKEHSFIPSVAGNYADGDLVPFQITDPYFEFAFDEDSNEIVGVRLGFGEAMGMMTGSIQSMTGNVNVAIRDTAAGIKAAHENKIHQPDYQLQPMDDLLTWLTPYLVGGSPIETPSELATTSGEPDPVRATHIGMLNGTDFVVKDVNKLVAAPVALLKPLLSSKLEIQGCSGLFDFSCDLHIESQNCKMLGIDTCFPLSKYENLPVGKLSGDRKKIVAPAPGMFMSFQSRDDLPWATTHRTGDATTASDYIKAARGAFFNVPNGVVEVNLSEIYKPKVPMVRQEYINRGRGLF